MLEIIGYDPGGNNSHGLCLLTLEDDYSPRLVRFRTCSSVSELFEDTWSGAEIDIIGIGIDTLTKWCTAKSGWRPADKWLRDHYPQVKLSVASPNSLYGSMVIGGIGFKGWVADNWPEAVISETHPKVLYYALFGKKYDWAGRSTEMAEELSSLLGIEAKPANDHEFDAALSCWAVLMGLTEKWTLDLHKLPCPEGTEYIEPYGNSVYFWPEPQRASRIDLNNSVEF